MMQDDQEKLLIRIGESFEANATGRLAIVIVFAVFCVMAFAAFL